MMPARGEEVKNQKIARVDDLYRQELGSKFDRSLSVVNSRLVEITRGRHTRDKLSPGSVIVPTSLEMSICVAANRTYRFFGDSRLRDDFLRFSLYF